MPTQDEVVVALGNMTVVELITLTKELETLWGVEAKPQVVENTAPVETVVQGPAQTEFDVWLVSYPADKKMGLIKLVREVMGTGLKESKELVESTPKVIKEDLSKDDSEVLKARLTEAGGTVEIK